MKKMLAVVAAAACVAFAAPAFAANPFMDVPMHHWAYDAVEQLAAHGVITGYPDGTFKGNKPITRYEMAMMIARAMNKGGLTGEDAAVLKKLVVEFKDELDNLGVKVDGLESGVGGWKFWGQLRLDYKSFDKDDGGINMSRYRIWMSKQVDENIKFTGRWNNQDATFDRFWMDVDHFLFDSTLRAGKFAFDWEDDDGLYVDNDGFMTDFAVQGFQLKKSFGAGEFTALAARLDDGDLNYKVNYPSKDTPYSLNGPSSYVYGARFKIAPSEKLWLSLNALWMDPSLVVNGLSAHINNYWAALGFNFADGFELKGAYYMQDQKAEVFSFPAGYDDSPSAWTAILSVDQSVLKFTNLWVQYASFDKGYIAMNAPWNNYDFDVTPALANFDTLGSNVNRVMESKNPGDALTDVDVWFVRAEQPWGEKFGTFERFVKANNGAGDGYDVKNWTVGVSYKYSPALNFELAYDDVKYDNGNPFGLEDDHMVRFRTLLSF